MIFILSGSRDACIEVSVVVPKAIVAAFWFWDQSVAGSISLISLSLPSLSLFYLSSNKQGLSFETLTLESTSGSPISFPKTGCGHRSTISSKGRSSGIIGLGGGAISLITQIGSSIDGKFSYCLVPMFLASNSLRKLKFGDTAIVSGEGTVSTPIFQGDVDVFYYITLEAISVGDKRIEFGSSSFESGQEGNIIIDSGTTLNIFPDDVYSNLESALVDAMKEERVEDPSQQMSLCYQISSKQLEIPTFTAHFKDGDVTLNALISFVQDADRVRCFAFAHSQTDAILWNWAQQSYLL
ncbi:aspartic proteinase CDR1-like [Lotus japonicus]|uniref:aspartic proteinase CDR1-like n=1 Tax=Lotus japonicus TaxID=34305 RepID=UPI002585BDC8|nr:aspartic proteinase CDR1-like [Lotus japonicus]